MSMRSALILGFVFVAGMAVGAWQPAFVRVAFAASFGEASPEPWRRRGRGADKTN